MKKLLVSGSAGLIGSEVCSYFFDHGWIIHGIDKNLRKEFFGPQGDTRYRQKILEQILGAKYIHHEIDIRDRMGVHKLISDLRPNAIVHAAAQPSHDKSAEIPLVDFDINATGTLNLLESARQFCSDSPFVLLSTNKVYGDNPNRISLREQSTRWDFDDPVYNNGIPETLSIDHCTHSPFGVSKLAADLMTQEYGRYFKLPTCCLRGGCLTGPSHAGVELHGFLSYLVKSNLEEKNYTIFGYKGKQVRDNILSHDVASFISQFIEKPRYGEVYNLGGGSENSCSILEAIGLIESMTGKKQITQYTDSNRIGDHICYYSDLTRIKTHYPDWEITIPLRETIRLIVEKHARAISV